MIHERRLPAIPLARAIAFCLVFTGAAGAAPRMQGTVKAYLGTIPDYAVQVDGVKLKAVVKGSPADKAGVRAGDVVVKLAGRDIRSLRDYADAFKNLEIGKRIKLGLKRKGKPVSVDVVPGPRPKRNA